MEEACGDDFYKYGPVALFEEEVVCIPAGCHLFSCRIQKEALFLPLVPLLKWCQLKEVPVKGARCFCLLLGFNSSFSSLEAHDSYAKSRDILILYLLGKTDALIPLSLLADEPSRWEPHFQIVLQQK